MNNSCSSKLTHPCVPRGVCASWTVLLVLLARPAIVQAQFTFTTNNGTITITGYIGSGGAVTIPNSINGLLVTSIGDCAFYSCGSLASVRIGSVVISIGNGAFSRCTWLSAITVDALNWAYSSVDGVLFNKGQSTLVQFPGGKTGSYTIPDRVITIGDSAFVYWRLASVTLPNSVTSIGIGGFALCDGLMAITVGEGNPYYSSVDGVLFNRGQNTLLQFPGGKAGSYTIPNSVTSIGSIGYSAFAYCTNLSSVTIPNSVTSIRFDAFGWCAGLTNVTIGNGVTSIEDFTFEYCSSLTSVTFPDSLTNIGNSVFWYCTSLTSVTIPNSVTSIGRSAFWSCTSLRAITVDTRNPSYSSVDGVLLDKGQHTVIECPEGKIGSYNIPDSVNRIGMGAFSSCTSLTGVTIPNSVTNIEGIAFLGCTNLREITVDAVNPSYSSVDGVLFDKSQTTLIQWPRGRTGIYNVPDGVRDIGARAFESCIGLSSITLPNSVTNIGAAAFIFCAGLTNATIGNGVTGIGDTAFSYCTGLTDITIPDSVMALGYYVFTECTNLAGLYFTGNAPAVGGPDVFQGDNNATVYYLPGTTGWGTTFGGRPTAPWPPTTIQTDPQTQTTEAGSVVDLKVQASSPLPLFYRWYWNVTNLISCSTIGGLELTNVQFSQSGTYTVVVSNACGGITSAPAMLQVITPVERRPIPGVKVTGEAGSVLKVDFTDTLSPAPDWTTLGSVNLTSTSQYYFDLTLPLPQQRFYRVHETADPAVFPVLDLHMVPAITVTGSIGHSVRVDCINRFGPIDAWVTLDTVTLTNTTQLYFDMSAPERPQWLYRLVQVP